MRVGDIASGGAGPVALERKTAATSAYGRPLAIVFGTNRVAPSIILSGLYLRKVGYGVGIDLETVQIAICEGVSSGVLNIWREKEMNTPAFLGVDVAAGNLPQSPWAQLVGLLAPFALGYGGVVTGSCVTGWQLVSTGELERCTVEVRGIGATEQDGASAAYDANAHEILANLLTSGIYGLGWDVSVLGDQSGGVPFRLGADGTTASGFARYCDANGWYMSPAITEQRATKDIVQEVLTATDSVAVWSEGTLKVRPLGEVEVVGATTFTPYLTPVYDLGASGAGNDFGGSSGEAAITVERTPRADTYNCHPVEWSNRFPARKDVTGATISEPWNAYNSDVEDGTPDPVDVSIYGLRKAAPTVLRCITRPAHAKAISDLLTRRALYTNRNRFRFRLGWRFALLEPTDLVTITDAGLGLSRRLARITEIEEQEDGSFDVVAEEVSTVGTAGAAAYAIS